MLLPPLPEAGETLIARAGTFLSPIVERAPFSRRKLNDAQAKIDIVDAGSGRPFRKQTRFGHSRDRVHFEHEWLAGIVKSTSTRP